MNTLEIFEAIKKIGTVAELKVVRKAHAERLRELQAGDAEIARRDFSLNQFVSFIHKGREVFGKIIKINLKTARVNVSPNDSMTYAGEWNVAYTLLRSG